MAIIVSSMAKYVGIMAKAQVAECVGCGCKVVIVVHGLHCEMGRMPRQLTMTRSVVIADLA